jgi:hypothetical protein
MPTIFTTREEMHKDNCFDHMNYSSLVHDTFLKFNAMIYQTDIKSRKLLFVVIHATMSALMSDVV